MNENKLAIRKAIESDYSLVAAFGARTFEESYADSNSPSDLAEYLTFNFNETHIRAQLIDQASLFLLAYLDDTLVGYSMLFAGDSPVELSATKPIELVRIYIDRNHAGMGYGSRLMEACLERVDEAGYDVIWLGVWEKNERAIDFYKKWGFKKIGLKEFVLGNEVQRDLIMMREVS